MTKPHVLVMSGYGLNCEDEAKFGFERAGARADIIHINDLVDGVYSLKDYQIIVMPGGFSYGDDTGSGNAFGNKIRGQLWDKVKNFLARDTLIIGICNGFQILVSLGLLPAFDKNYGEREVALLHNSTVRYTVRWVDLRVQTRTPWLDGIETLMLPIGHGEGKFYASADVLKKLKKKNLVALRYIAGEITEQQALPANPNGSLDDIAGIIDETRRVFGLMPHPDRASLFTHLPHWPYLKEKYRREGKEMPVDGPGMSIFRNAVRYFQ